MATKAKVKQSTAVDLEALLSAGAHFGHHTRRWNPKMEEYLYGSEGGVHIFDLIKTKEALESALSFLKKAKEEGKRIVLLGTKKQIKEKVREVGEATKTPYINERWLGGTVSNFDMIKKSLRKLEDLKKGVISGEFNQFTKKERLLIDREITRLERFFGGLVNLDKVPEVLFVIDTKKEVVAIREARAKNVIIIGLVDTNSNPEGIDYVIPMNDDASRAVSYVLDLVKETLS